MATVTKTSALETVSISRRSSSRQDERIRLLNSELKKGSNGFGYEDFMKLPNVHSQPRPGDIYTGFNRHRPLGLLPNKRNRTWKQLGVFVHNETPKHPQSLKIDKDPTYSPSAPPEQQLPSEVILADIKGVQVSKRRRLQPTTGIIDERIAAAEDDQEYLNTLAQCNLKEYENLHLKRYQQPGFPTADGHGNKQGIPPQLYFTQMNSPRGFSGTLGLVKDGRLNPSLSSNLYHGKKSLQYLSFFHQAQLNKRTMFTDCRNAKDYEPCERCALRGTRCSHCKAIRTGGGYIILDGASDQNLAGGYRDSMGFYHGSSSTRMHSSGHRGAMSSRRHGDGEGLDSNDLYYDESGRPTGDDEFDFANGSNAGRRGRDGALNGADSMNMRAAEGRGSGHINNDFTGHGKSIVGNVSKYENDEDIDSSFGIRGGTGNMDARDQFMNGGESGLSSKRGNNEDSSNGSDSTGMGRRGKQDGGRGEGSYGGGHGGHTQDQQLNNNDNDSDGLDQDHGGIDAKRKWGNDLEKARMSRNDCTNDEGQTNRSRGGVASSHGYRDDDIGSSNNNRRHVDFSNKNDDKEPSSTNHSTYDLMRFKSKTSKVRAKSCTLRELKGIDPLDYLAKYCIIDQEKVPHYERVFENVDRDEDGEINVSELDFALKAVNYNLISDAELVYVNKVLELAGRYALNFQLFTLVAALSEKVVSLDDMVKRIVNTMDFEALETKMKKCKELFYLLANRDELEEDDGVVTSSALGIELNAGGLTQEHVDYVIAHLDQENKGKIEFLDYLVYVPLFVEIHGSINSNPLDFSRTK